MKPKVSDLLRGGILLFAVGIILFYSGCTKLNPTYNISFVTVREADFRVGPVRLPLDAAGRDAVLSFLERGGDLSIDDYVDAGSRQHYKGLMDLLSNPDFLYAVKFRKSGRMDTVSPDLEPWFHKSIIYQLIDARLEKPPVPAPLCVTDGQHWWIFYMRKEKPGGKDFKITELLITTAPSKTLKHYGKIKEDKGDKKYGKQTKAGEAVHSGGLPDMHDTFLQRLNKIADVYLVARLQTEKLAFSGRDMRVFIPDIHLLDSEREQAYKYHSNHYDLLVQLVGKLKNFKQDVEQADKNFSVTVYQLGDFFDLWREIPFYWKEEKADLELQAYVKKMQEDRHDLYMLMRDPVLDVQFILGNHDFDIHNIESYVNNELYFYFPIKVNAHPAAFTIHGDILDSFEAHMPETLKHLAVYYYGPFVKGHTINVDGLREVVMSAHGKNQYSDTIQPKAHLGLLKKLRHSGDLPPGNFNIIYVKDNKNEADIRFGKEAKAFAKMIDDETGWNLKFAVIGHTHHARIVIDNSDDPGGRFFALIDCGAWIQDCGVQVGDDKFLNEMPSAQIGVIYNNDARVYQLKPRGAGTL